MRACRKAALLVLALAGFLWLLKERSWLLSNEEAIEAAVQARLRIAEAELQKPFATVATVPGAACPPQAACPPCSSLVAGRSDLSSSGIIEIEANQLRAEPSQVDSATSVQATVPLPIGSKPSSSVTQPSCATKYQDHPELDKYLGGCVASRTASDNGECGGYSTLEEAQEICSGASSCAGVTHVDSGLYEPRIGPELRDR
eukprot:SAG31_NODE_785_length_12089_cov_4.342936_8_plen_201_part_00